MQGRHGFGHLTGLRSEWKIRRCGSSTVHTAIETTRDTGHLHDEDRLPARNGSLVLVDAAAESTDRFPLPRLHDE